jgi:glyoxylase-like metal-dependent hydrolase (beta-lactamase superfamily II)
MKIYRIETGKVKVKTRQIRKSPGFAPKLLKVLLDKEWTDWLPIFTWVIDHPEGIIVVDTGETARTAERGYLPRWHPYYRMGAKFCVKPEDEIGPQLQKIGINPKKDVKKVIMTHLHTDHAGGLRYFPNSEIMIEENEYRGALGVKGIFKGYLPHRWPKWLKPSLFNLKDQPYETFKKSMEVTRDGTVLIVATPGHVPTHVSVIVLGKKRDYFLAGDASYTQNAMLQGIPDGIGSIPLCLATLQNIREYTELHPTVYLPSHDPMADFRMDNKKIVPVYAKVRSLDAIETDKS